MYSFFFSCTSLPCSFLFSSFGVVRVCASVSVILYSGFPLPLPRLMLSIVVLFFACVFIAADVFCGTSAVMRVTVSLSPLLFFYVHSFSCMQSFRFCSTLLCFHYGFPLFSLNYVYVYPLLRFFALSQCHSKPAVDNVDCRHGSATRCFRLFFFWWCLLYVCVCIRSGI